jgi:hypothetical protein
MLKPFEYPFAEFVGAFRHGATQTGVSQTGAEFMTPWFASRYTDPEERLFKLSVYMAVMQYLAEYRDVLDAARLNVSGSHESGDLAHGVLVRLLLGHFRQTFIPPKPEQVIARARQLIDEGKDHARI